MIRHYPAKYGNYNHFIRRLLALLLFTLIPSFCFAENLTGYNYAFYYGNNPPLPQLRFYSNVIFDPNSGVDPQNFNTEMRTAYAYVSVGEATKANEYGKPMPANWFIGKNTIWQTLVIDQSNPDWQKFFLNDIITPLWNKGYRGFFLDTLDSYQLAAKKPDEIKKQQAGLITLINSIKAKYPNAKLILNRGFEILPQIKSSVDGVAAESLFSEWDNQRKQYVDVSEQARKQLLDRLNVVKQMNIPVIVIDYTSPNQPQKAREIAQKISNLGFWPWVTNGDLTALLLFNTPTMPRKILLFYDAKPHDIDEKLYSYALTNVAMPLNFLGYVTILQDVNDPLPKSISKNEYAGIVMAIDGIAIGKEQQLRNWYLEQMQKGIPIVILNNFGFNLDNHSLTPFGLSMPFVTHTSHSLKLIIKSPMMGYEIFPQPSPIDFVPLELINGECLLTYQDEVGSFGDLAAITSWGGYVLYPYVFSTPTPNNTRWVINPFIFFKKALRLPDMPVPDTTTENGRRLMMAHIDGDGFANKAQWYKGPFVGEVMIKEILNRYQVPNTVSIIEGEVASNGLYPKLTKDLEKIARQIFALPWVEIASHTFSHPYNWQYAQSYRGKKPNPYTLPIPNYHFNLEAEIIGSVNYINKSLAPSGKYCKVFLWSGEADVDEKALALTYQIGLRNMNGGSMITKYINSMVRVSPLGVYEGPYYQVFAPIGNDFEFTQRAQGPTYEIVNIIDALKLTDQPKRLKPIDIYYHFYTVQEIGGYKALQQVYDWALAQPVINVFVSDYVDTVWDFLDMSIVKKDNGWLYVTNDKLRELRIPHSMGYPDLVNSKNIIGYNSYNDDYYIHTGPGGQAFLVLTDQPPQIPYLVDANARVTSFKRDNKNINFTLEGYLPPKFSLANMQNCSLWEGNNQITPKTQQQGQQSYELTQGTQHGFSIQCR